MIVSMSIYIPWLGWSEKKNHINVWHEISLSVEKYQQQISEKE